MDPLIRWPINAWVSGFTSGAFLISILDGDIIWALFLLAIALINWWIALTIEKRKLNDT